MLTDVPPGYILPSAALTVPRRLIARYGPAEQAPRAGDVVYGKVVRIGQHSQLENKHGRIHTIYDGTKAVFVYGNRYAPDYYESVLPAEARTEVDMVARSGVIGTVRTKNSGIKDPTRIRVLGQVFDPSGVALNTRDHPMITVKGGTGKTRRAKLILVVGTSMNAGKSMAAAACCWALSTMGHEVRASKVTGTASLKDILNMNDAGAAVYNDFTHLGHPSTYMLDEPELLGIFNTIDQRYGNNPRNYWVVEFADGILQRETAMLLSSPDVQQRLHRLIFCAGDALGGIGGLQVLKERFDLTPAAVSGLVSSSPLGIQELAAYTDIPVFNSVERDLKQLAALLI